MCILKGTLVLSIICIECKNEDEKVFKEELIDWDWDIKDSQFNWKKILPEKYDSRN